MSNNKTGINYVNNDGVFKLIDGSPNDGYDVPKHTMDHNLPLQFHPVHSENIERSSTFRGAERISSGGKFNGFCFSDRPVTVEECIHFKCYVDSSSGGFQFGFISHDPSTVTASTLPSNISPDLFDILGYATQTIPKKYTNFSHLLSFYYKLNGDVMYCVDGEEKGIFFSGVKTSGSIWALFDIDCPGYVLLYRGPTTGALAKKLVSDRIWKTVDNLLDGTDEVVGSTAGQSNTLGGKIGSNELVRPCLKISSGIASVQASTTKDATIRSSDDNLPLRFHQIHSENINLSVNLRRASRSESDEKFNGFCFSNRPVAIDERICFKSFRSGSSLSGSIQFGFIDYNPSSVTAGTLPRVTSPGLFSTMGYATKAIPKEYTNSAYILSFYYKLNGDVMYCVDGEEKGIFFSGVKTSGSLWALFDIDCIGIINFISIPSTFSRQAGSRTVTKSVENLGVDSCDAIVGATPDRSNTLGDKIGSSEPVRQLTMPKIGLFDGNASTKSVLDGTSVSKKSDGLHTLEKVSSASVSKKSDGLHTMRMISTAKSLNPETLEGPRLRTSRADINPSSRMTSQRTPGLELLVHPLESASSGKAPKIGLQNLLIAERRGVSDEAALHETNKNAVSTASRGAAYKSKIPEKPVISSEGRFRLQSLSRFYQNKEDTAGPVSDKKSFNLNDLKLCEKHVSGKQCPLGQMCDSLHVYKFYLLTGTCEFVRHGRLCKFGHTLDDAHNRTLLQKHSLDSLPLKSLNAHFQNKRTKPLYPIVCTIFNTMRSCQRSNVCVGLHVCKNYVMAECRFGSRCHYSHNIFDAQPAKILIQFGFDHRLTERQILSQLKHGFSLRSVDADQSSRGDRSPMRNYDSTPRLSLATDSWEADEGVSNRTTARKRGRTASRGRTGVEGQGSKGRSRTREREVGRDKEITEEDNYELVDRMTRRGTGRHDWTSTETNEDGNESMPIICSFFVVGRCSYSGKCRRRHYTLPYLWQFLNPDNGQWVDFSHRINCRVEGNFCNPDWNGCSDQIAGQGGKIILFIAQFKTMSVNFYIGKDLTAQTGIRRLSTRNSVTAPDTLPLLTNWNWYWQMDSGAFLKYDSNSESSGNEAEVHPDSKKLEECFNGDRTKVLQWTSKEFKYEVDFSRMVQINCKTGRERKLCRRPDQFVDEAMIEEERKKQRERRPRIRDERGFQNRDLPAFWDLSTTNESDSFQLVPIGKTGQTFHEYEKIETQFFESMGRDNYRINKIQRIQNADLYRGFQFYKNRMAKRASSDAVEEKFLFHGTKQEYIDAICLQGFDFRVSGTSTGSLYGHGSYFAKDAFYSRNYTDSCQLFVARVLIGRYTKGESHYKRPPPKDPNKPLEEVFDSCVDEEKNPRIFVVFAIEQAYPEYLIDYQKI